ncbi:tubulin-like doman-containing protein [Planococcus sp. APC 4015]|nr:tubulin-like doman-containing protein [Planococcus sp. APC 4015]
MLRPFLIIGVGGSGGKTLRGIEHQLQLKLQQLGWTSGMPAAWRFLHFDTPTSQDGADYAIPFLPTQQYKGLVSTGATYNTVYRSIENAHSANRRVHKDIERQLPDPRYVKVDVTKGAGQFRAVGRAVALASTKEIAGAARAAIARLGDAAALAELRTLGQTLKARGEGGDGSPTVIVISSVAGGSGAGQFLDVIEIVKSTAKQHPWSNQFFSILYAPDVFDQLNVSAGMPGNALSAIAETMNGFWSDTPSESTLELLKQQGVAPSYGAAMDRIGAAYPFIVGRSNSKVTFEDQNAVYNAVATSLTAWMTDERVQDDMVAYSSGNWQARVGANVLADASGLSSPVHHSPPFSSMGFGRVTLGRERFLEYSAERLARSVIDRTLFAHSEDDPMFALKTEREWIESGADKSYQRFLNDLHLNEETESNNQVIDSLRASDNLTQIKAELTYGIEQRLLNGAALDKSGGLDLSQWADRFAHEYTTRAPELLDRDQRARQMFLDDWTKTQPSEILHTVGRYVSTVGLPVVLSMLGRLDRTLRSAAEGLEAESHQHEEWVRSLGSLVAAELSSAPNQGSIRPDQDVIGHALERLGQVLEWSSEARLRLSASRLLGELRTEFLAPLRAHLQGALTAMLQRVGDRRTTDERANEYDFWPKRIDATVPRKYEPAPNERLLIDYREYPAEFERLVRASTGSDKYQDAVLEVITDLLAGVAPAKVVEGDHSTWSLIANPKTWKASVTADADTSYAQQAPHFRMETDPESYIERARLWMRREGMPFQAYISEDLLDFFDEAAVTPDVFASRRDRYREQLQAALGASEPLVKLNAALLREVHGKSVNEDTSLVFSSIPFREGTEMYTITKAVLAQLGFWDDATSESWFRDANVDGIEVFAMSGFPYQPIVMDSVMEPIARGWLSQSNTQDSREAFWQFKRARLLGEAIPADPRMIASMIRGWYVAKVLGQLDVDNDHGERGPKLSIWSAPNRAFVDFPHPLLSARNAQSIDYPGAVMQSLTIAIALCQVDATLAPLAAYKALAALGGEPGAPSPALTDWLQRGALPAGAPEPKPDRAGARSSTLAERQKLVSEQLERELAAFRANVVEQDDHVSPYDYPVSWEIRTQIIDAIESLMSTVMATRTEDLGI